MKPSRTVQQKPHRLEDISKRYPPYFSASVPAGLAVLRPFYSADSCRHHALRQREIQRPLALGEVEAHSANRQSGGTRRQFQASWGISPIWRLLAHMDCFRACRHGSIGRCCGITNYLSQVGPSEHRAFNKRATRYLMAVSSVLSLALHSAALADFPQAS